ncbi:MAG: kynurenine formamidase [Acidobacteria bacterium]|nr:MAG: kynurenine formamidase [Acidobacteriota bacterium]
MAQLIDISPALTEDLAVWPGDVPYRRYTSSCIDAGDHLELSSIRTTVHVGAHADAPSHYVKGGQGIGERSLEYYYGPCQVLQVNTVPGRRIFPGDLDGTIQAPRLLLKTGTYPDPRRFHEDFSSLSPELVRHAHDAGVILIGIDTPSVDPFSDKMLESHQALARHDMANLEGLVLEAVKPGHYTLIALPLRIPDADASPVRAVLIPA